MFDVNTPTHFICLLAFWVVCNLTFEESMDNEGLLQAINQVMPYGKYKGRQLLDLPEPYLVWYHGKGFPQGKLGAQLALIYEVKLNGLEGMLRRFQR